MVLNLASQSNITMSASTGCCGNLIRSTLAIINGLFSTIGAVIVTVSAYARWNSRSLLSQLEQKESFTISVPFNVGTLVLLILGTLIILLSVCGLFGAINANKCLLVVYQVAIVVVFVCHGASLVSIALESQHVEMAFRHSLNRTVHDLKNCSDANDFEYKCTGLYVLSSLFDCCAYNGSSDFAFNRTLDSLCCNAKYTDGCANKTIVAVKENVIFFVVVPNGVVLAFELALIVLVPFLIGRISRANDQDYMSATADTSIYHYEPYLYNNRGNKVY